MVFVGCGLVLDGWVGVVVFGFGEVHGVGFLFGAVYSVCAGFGSFERCW